MGVFTNDVFKFKELRVSNDKIVAFFSERDSIFDIQYYTQDERQIYGLLESTTALINSGNEGKRLKKNHTQFLDAFNAIRTAKVQNGIPLDIQNHN